MAKKDKLPYIDVELDKDSIRDHSIEGTLSIYDGNGSAILSFRWINGEDGDELEFPCTLRSLPKIVEKNLDECVAGINEAIEEANIGFDAC